MLYPNCLTASESFALPAHNSTKTGVLDPSGICKSLNKPEKRRSAHSLGSTEDPWPALPHACKNLNSGVCSLPPSRCRSVDPLVTPVLRESIQLLDAVHGIL